MFFRPAVYALGDKGSVPFRYGSLDNRRDMPDAVTSPMFRLFWISLLLLAGCATSPPPAPETAALARAPKPALLPTEAHLADLRRLTFGGENAEAYWSFDGKQLSFQARRGSEACDRIMRMTARPAARVERQGSHDLRAFPARRPRADLRLGERRRSRARAHYRRARLRRLPDVSPDGQWLASSSNRATPPGQHDTNVACQTPPWSLARCSVSPESLA